MAKLTKVQSHTLNVIRCGGDIQPRNYPPIHALIREGYIFFEKTAFGFGRCTINIGRDRLVAKEAV